ncbi:AMP-binding protein, partial [Nonomuraea sp. NPDC002799]
MIPLTFAQRPSWAIHRLEAPGEWSPVNRTTAGTLVEAFEARVAADPGRTALIFEGRAWTYGELNGWSNRIAHWLRERGAGPERLVAVRMARSADMV